MSYTQEEASLIDGLLSSYMLSHGAPITVKEKYLTVHNHLAQNTLTSEDLIHIKDGLYFLLPLFNKDRQTQREMVYAIATTQAMIKGVA